MKPDNGAIVIVTECYRFVRTSLSVTMLGCSPYLSRISTSSPGSRFSLLMICHTHTRTVTVSTTHQYIGHQGAVTVATVTVTSHLESRTIDTTSTAATCMHYDMYAL